MDAVPDSGATRPGKIPILSWPAMVVAIAFCMLSVSWMTAQALGYCQQRTCWVPVMISTWFLGVTITVLLGVQGYQAGVVAQPLKPKGQRVEKREEREKKE
mmetsp:Transcript_45025/g.107300  ORF Transcript_45025/g.107300 Transcript_45025/m.107300 type:complete len:101 (+) Transcript_45025:85-387(+)